MKDKLIFNDKIEIRKSKLHGWGVFAKSDIKSGEILEEDSFLIIPMSQNESSSIFIDYRFNFPRTNSKCQVIPFGFSCLYNHSEKPNAAWETNDENNLFIFSAIRDIKKDEEICIYYGDINYWNEGRSHTKII
jgi:SET domain-containing protein